jgi:hypothetical protein
MKSERLAFHPRQRQNIEIFSDLPFERNDSSVAPFAGVEPFVAHLYFVATLDVHADPSQHAWLEKIPLSLGSTCPIDRPE